MSINWSLLVQWMVVAGMVFVSSSSLIRSRTRKDVSELEIVGSVLILIGGVGIASLLIINSIK
jgi:hypothetical protein